MRRGPLSLIVAGGVAGALIVGIGVGRATGGTDDPAPAAGPVVSTLTTTSAGETRTETVTGTVTAPPTTVTVTETGVATAHGGETAPASMATVAYLVSDGRAIPVARQAPQSTAVLRAALLALLGGPTAAEDGAGFSTAIPHGTELRGVRFAGGVATVDLSGSIANAADPAVLRLRLAQVVTTATRVRGVRAVRLLVDGAAAATLGDGGPPIAAPVGRDAIEDELPAILVESPLIGARVRCPVRVTGSSNVFEATALGVVVGADGVEPEQPTVITATSGSGTRGVFSQTIPCTDDAPGAPLTVRLWQPSAEDGSRRDVVDIPVTVAG